MKTILAPCAAVAMLAALSGCGDPAPDDSKLTPQGPVHDVQWFIEHNEAREVVFAACKNNPGEYRELPNCANANEAKKKVFYQQAIDAAKKLK